MVLQRYSPIEVWGWSSPEEKITVTFNVEQTSTIASSDGNLIVSFKKMNEGGPYSMKINGTNEITLKDILIGDVWLCMGQSQNRR